MKRRGVEPIFFACTVSDENVDEMEEICQDQKALRCRVFELKCSYWRDCCLLPSKRYDGRHGRQVSEESVSFKVCCLCRGKVKIEMFVFLHCSCGLSVAPGSFTG